MASSDQFLQSWKGESSKLIPAMPLSRSASPHKQKVGYRALENSFALSK
jgi:hypothetical protein